MSDYLTSAGFRKSEIKITPHFTRLRDLRHSKGLTLIPLSAICGLPQSTLSSLENGKRTDVAGRNLVALSEALGVEPSYFYEIDLPKAKKKTASKKQKKRGTK